MEANQKGMAFRYFGCHGKGSSKLKCWCPGCGLENCQDRRQGSNSQEGVLMKAFKRHHEGMVLPHIDLIMNRKVTRNLLQLNLQQDTWVPVAEIVQAWQAAGCPSAR